MCGIGGLVWKNHLKSGSAEQGRTVANAIMSAINHRGPDGNGMHVTDRFTIGHVRLAIIDVEGSPQPMWSPSRDVALVYNGEVYNFPELMRVQSSKGWHHVTRSDTETLLAEYITNGINFDYKLNGMYAYAIADTRSGFDRLQIGIDPVGIKPLYIWEDSSVFVFASELQGIIAALTTLKIPICPNPRAITNYLSLGWVPQPETLIEGVRKLPPGARLQVDLKSGMSVDLPTRGFPEPKYGDLKHTIRAAVKRQLISDVPIGFFLSGGIDSSLLVATASDLGITPKTFTVRFISNRDGISGIDEADVAMQVAKICRADHHEISVSALTLREMMDEAFIAMDQPISDPACLPLLCLSRLAREHVKVCLTGDGGDELFHGYSRHAHASLKQHWHRVPNPIRNGATSIANLLPDAPSTGLLEKMRKIGVGFHIINDPYFAIGPFSGRYARCLSVKPLLPHWASNVKNKNEDLFQADMLGQLSGQLLPKTDHIGMYAGLECRVPYLDLEVIANARILPIDQKRDGSRGKLPLRNLLVDFVPASIVNRPKQGFRVPLTDWFRTDLAETVRSRLLDPGTPLYGMISRSNIEKILSTHIRGEAEHSIRIWSMLALQSWLDRHTN
jgi:asparagine synthase (glutamine-hydrolysing)